ncbi:OsmC family protein [Pseudomonas sp. LS1212]|uniref:OsmC family protein n=1 Tax=Pseudomonas sp. LS1212 TaxID=2972478 RepID=UPI00215D0D91|nr:OsmC family protein [Pseudomonas sp. LS1212]UVJ45276.1 OsmC family protein [Pseudomonas sp. LS1212]
MAAQDIATALQRVETVLRRHPEAGLHDDTPVMARWEGGTRVAARHANGTQVLTDMPTQLGGNDDRVTPGWLLRAGLASCALTGIAMAAALEGIELGSLEVQASSRSDLCGLLGVPGTDGQPVGAEPQGVELQVRISAPGVSPERLQALVEDSQRRSPVCCALQHPVPVVLHIEVVGG